MLKEIGIKLVFFYFFKRLFRKFILIYWKLRCNWNENIIVNGFVVIICVLDIWNLLVFIVSKFGFFFFLWWENFRWLVVLLFFYCFGFFWYVWYVWRLLEVISDLKVLELSNIKRWYCNVLILLLMYLIIK